MLRLRIFGPVILLGGEINSKAEKAAGRAIRHWESRPE
jgi:hypothetical protein